MNKVEMQLKVFEKAINRGSEFVEVEIFIHGEWHSLKQIHRLISGKFMVEAQDQSFIRVVDDSTKIRAIPDKIVTTIWGQTS